MSGRMGMGRRSGGREMPRKPRNTKEALKFLMAYVRLYRFRFAGMVFFALAAVVFTLLVPRLIGSFIDNELTQTLKTRQPAPNLYISIIHLVVIYAAVFLCNVVQGIISARTSAALVQRLRYDIFKKLTRLPVSYFDTTPHGDLMSRLTNDVDNINNGFSSIVTSLFTGITTLVMAVIFMVSASLVLSATVLITLPLGIIISAFITRRTRRYFAAQQEKLGLLNAYIEEHLLGQREIKAFGREETVKAEFGELNNSLRQIGVQAQFYSNSIPPIINAVNNFSFVLMITVGVWLAFNNMLGITIGLIAAFGQYARQLSRPINDLANQVNMLQSILAGAERVMELLHEKEEQDEGSDRLDAADAGSLTFKHISFSYVPDNPVLKDISFHVREGETMAIVGPTGSGKTTLINLLMRFYTAQSGSIMFNNKDIKLFSRQSLRSRIGIVLQDNYLFRGTLADNIAYGRPGASEQAIAEAARQANADTFITKLEGGFHFKISEGGSNLSQGERQLIAIARTLLADPQLLILDEATSAVDSRTERHIQQAMDELMKNRSSIVIAHRLSTIEKADTILYLENGAVVERGSHNELLAARGAYYRLYMSQFDGELQV